MSNLHMIHSAKSRSFTILNLNNVEDKQLSWKAKGIYTYLASRPPGWTVRYSDLIGRSPDGETSFKAGLRELMDLGYVHRFQTKKDGKHVGQFGPWMYYVFESPTTSGQCAEYLDEISAPRFSGGGKQCPLIYNRESISNIETEYPLLEEEEEPLQEGDRADGERTPPSAHSHRPPNIPDQGEPFARSPGIRRRIGAERVASARVNPPLLIPARVQEVIGYWHGLPGLRRLEMPRRCDPGNKSRFLNPTKALRDATNRLRSLLAGKPLPGNGRVFAMDDIKRAMSRFHLAATDPDYAPMNKEKMRGVRLGDFLYNPFGGRPTVDGAGPKGISWLAEFADRDPILARENIPSVKEDDAEWTKALAKACFPKDGMTGLDKAERNKIIRGANKLKALADDYSELNIDRRKWCRYMLEALRWKFSGGGAVELGNVASDYTYDTVVEQYLTHLRVLDDAKTVNELFRDHAGRDDG